MLKALIQLFAEKFLQNKSEWVGNQAMPDDSAERVIYTPQSSSGKYIAPFDGYVTLYTRCYEWAQIWNGNRGVLISAKGTTYQRIQMSVLKAPKFSMSFRTPWPKELKKRPLSLFQQSERNALTGGALC